MKSLFLLFVIMLVSGCATTTANQPVEAKMLVETSNLVFHTQKLPNGKVSVYKVVKTTYSRGGVAIPAETTCFWGTAKGELIPGPCEDVK